MSLEIYNIVKAKITTDDLEAYKTQADKMKEATRNEPGTISYDFFINEEKKRL
jgi:quinol monooxygenase YgiN